MRRNRSQRATAFLVGLACVLPATATAAAPSRTVDEAGPLKVGKPCPSFGGYALNNDMLSLSKLLNPPKGSPASAVVISFFASYCKPCKEQLPVIERVVASLSGRGVRGVLVDYGEEPEVAASFAEIQRLRLPIIADRFTKIAVRLGVGQKLPRTLVVGRDGNVRTIFEHEGDDFEKALRTAIASAMR
ncbi:MAG: TlpA disulfide reductase family protein [Polyangia bacterium]